MAVAGAGAKKLAIAGGVDINILESNVEAEVVQQTVSNVTVKSDVSAAGAVKVLAEDSETAVAITGGVAVSTGQAAIGAAVGVDLSYNTVTSLVNDSTLSTTVAQSALPAGTSAVDVEADANELLVSVTLGAAGGDKFALGGSVSVNELNDTVEAQVIGGSTITASGDVTIHAGDSTTMIVVSGGFAGSGKVAVGAAISFADVGDTIEAYIDGSTVTSSAGKVNVTAGFAPPTTAASLSTIDTGGSGVTLPTTDGSQIVNVTVAGSGAGKFAAGAAISLNWIDNTVEAYIKDNATVTGHGDVTVSATDSGQLDTGTLGAAGAGTAAVGAALAYDYIGGDPLDPVLNVPENPLSSSQAQVSAYIDGSTVESTTGNVYVTAMSEPSLVDVTAGGAGAGKVAIGGSISINFIRSIVDASILDNAHVTADAGDVDVSATTAPIATIVAGAASGAGTAAVGLASGTSDFKSGVTANIDDSTVTAYDVSLTATDNSTVRNLTLAGSGGGKFAAGVAVAVNIIDNTVEASISGNATVNTTDAPSGKGAVSLSATDTSSIDALAIGVAGSGGAAGGAAAAANVVTNTIGTEISGSTVNAGSTYNSGDTGQTTVKPGDTVDVLQGFAGRGNAGDRYEYVGATQTSVNLTQADYKDATLWKDLGSSGSTVTLDSEAESRIRALAVGVSGAANVAVGVTALGNYVGDTVTAAIDNGSTVKADDNVSVSVEDVAPSFLSWDLTGTTSNQQTALTNALAGSPISLTGNILAVMVSVAGSGSVAVSAALSGNIVHNVLDADIADSTVLAGVDQSGNVTNPDAGVSLSATSGAGITAITVGVGGSGSVAVQATGFGNVITDDTEAEISGGSTVKSGGAMSLTAKDQSQINSMALSVAASGSAAVSAIIGANVVTNSVDAIISASTVDAGTTLDLDAESQATIYGFVGGVAATGGAAVQVFFAANVIVDTTEAMIENAGGSYSVDASGALSITANDKSEIDALAIGVAASGGGAVAAGLSANVIVNTIEAEVTGSTVDTGSTFTESATSSEIIRALAVGVAGSGGFAVQVSAMGNAIANRVLAEVTDSTVIATGDISISAKDEAPSAIPGWILPAADAIALSNATQNSPIPADDNILAVMVGVAGTGTVAVNAVLSGNVIVNTVRTDIIDSTVKAGYTTSGSLIPSSTAGLAMTSLSHNAIMALTVGVAGSGAVAVNATGYGDVIATTTAATISGGSTVKSAGAMSLSAKDKSNIVSLGVSVAATGAVAVGALLAANVIANTVETEVTDSTVNAGTTLDLDSESQATILGLSVCVAGSGAAAISVSLAANVISDTTEALIVNSGTTASPVTAGGDVTLTAEDASEIDAFAVSVAGTGGGAVGVALSANVIANTIEAEIVGSTVTTTGGLDMTAQASEVIRSFALGVAASGGFAVQVTAIGNGIADSVLAEVTNSTVSAANSVNISAYDEAPSLIPDWTSQGLPFQDTSNTPNDPQSTLSGSFSGSIIAPSGNILAVVASVAGTGGVAVNGVIAGNVIIDTVRADIIDSTVRAGVASNGNITNPGANVSLTATSSDAIMAATVGVAGSGAVAVNATGFGNVIADTIAATISGGSTVASGGSTGLTAQNESSIMSLAIGVAGSTVAVAALIGANVITNTVEAEISGAQQVTAGGALTLDAESGANILGLSLCFGVGGFAGAFSFTANVISDTTEVLIVNSGTSGSPVNAGGAIGLTANDASQIDAIALGVAAGGAAGAMTAAANVIANTIEANIENSTVQTSSTLSQTAESSATIRTLVIGASAGGIGISLTVVGNLVTNTVEALIEGSAVTAGGTIALSATDAAPSSPGWIAPIDSWISGSNTQASDDHSQYASGTSNSPVSLSSPNILALVINVAGAGGVAGSVAVLGNEIMNTVETGIASSTVRAGVASNGTITNSAADITLTTLTNDSIVAAMAGFALAGTAAISANLMGNQIANTVSATVTDSTVRAGGQLALSAKDTSAITGFGLGFAVSFGPGISGNVVAADNDIGNTIDAEIVGSDVETGSDVKATALSDAGILSFVGGVAVSGGVSGNLSDTINHVHNTITASIENDGATHSTVNAGGLSGSTSAAVSLSAADTSTIDSIAIGLSASLFGAIGASTAFNHIGNTVEATIAESTVTSGGATDVTATSSDVIRSLAAGLSGAGGVAGQASVTSNTIGSTTEASIASSTVKAGGEVLVQAEDTAPQSIPAYASAITTVVDTMTNALSSNSHTSGSPTTGSILSFAGSIAGAGIAAGSAAISTNTIGNRISATVTDSTVTSTGSDVSVEAVSGEQIVSLAAGVGAALGAALNASATTNTITNNITAAIDGASTIEAGASSPVNVTATDTGSINSLALSLSGALGYALGGAVVTNNITDNTLAYVSGTSHTLRTGIDRAGLVTIGATSNETESGIALGASLGTVAAGASVVTSNIGGSTEASLANPSDYNTGDTGQTLVSPGETVDVLQGYTHGGNAGDRYEYLGSTPTLMDLTKANYGNAALWGDLGVPKGYVDVGKTPGMTVGGLTIEAASTATITSEVWGLSGGIGALTDNAATSYAAPVVEAYTGSDTNVQITGAMTISATATPQVESDAYGIAVGALAAGASDATATADPTVTSLCGRHYRGGRSDGPGDGLGSFRPVRGICECHRLDGRPRGRRRDGEQRHQFGHGDKLHSEQHDPFHRQRDCRNRDERHRPVGRRQQRRLRSHSRGRQLGRCGKHHPDPGLHGDGRHGKCRHGHRRPHGRRRLLYRP